MPTLLNVLDAGQDDDLALVVPGGIRLSYRQLREEVWRGAEALAARGVRRSDRVALVYPNSAEAIVLFLAAATAGTAAPLNPGYKVDEFRFYLEDTGARVLLVPPGQGAAARQALPDGAEVVEAAFDEQGVLCFPNGAGAGSPEVDAPAGDDVALVLHTSGTTSRPKMVPLRHRNLAASVSNIIPSYELTAEDVSLCVMPLFHVHGLVASTLSTFGAGGTVVVPPRFSPFEFWGLVHELRVTWYSAVPTIHQMLAGRSARPRPDGADTLRFARSCSSALSPELMARLEELLGVPVLEAYGMTEASHQMASNPLPPDVRRPGSVGRGTGVEVAVLDEHGTPLPAGAAGEVVVRGPNVMDGYEANPTANAEAFVDGWFRTGDEGVLDAGGYLTLRGRIKELINRGGEKIAPREIDEVLKRHPAVAEAVAFGVPHPSWGEEVAAAVVLSGEVEKRELTDFCRQYLADFKVPRQLFFVTEIPRTATGKIQRRHVAAEFAPS
ncbi:MAG TPA: acyl--CoA ligase [Candidatus Dormibacteraeota bacterium]|nr:acyl--CoA ligase [Candidatus Dormibacteraeota bacterium]